MSGSRHRELGVSPRVPRSLLRVAGGMRPQTAWPFFFCLRLAGGPCRGGGERDMTPSSPGHRGDGGASRRGDSVFALGDVPGGGSSSSRTRRGRGGHGGGHHHPGERVPVCPTSCVSGQTGGGQLGAGGGWGGGEVEGCVPPSRFRGAPSVPHRGPARHPAAPVGAAGMPTSPLLGPQQQPGSREAGSFQRSVVWVCLCFCNWELRCISLKHPISRHPAICSGLR